MKKFDLSTFGEGQLRYTVPRGEHLSTMSSLKVSGAGSELNVAGLVSQLGSRATWASVIPAGALGDRVLADYRAVGVDFSHVLRPENGRVASYYLEPAEAPLVARVTYDRENTPFREVDPALTDWDSLLDTRLLYLTGLTTLLTAKTAAFARYAVDEACGRGISVAIDVNYRSLLASPEEAREILRPLLRRASLVFCSRIDAARVFGIQGDGDVVAQALREQFEVPIVVSTDSTHGVFLAGDSVAEHFATQSVPVVDRPGAGDAFVGGVLHGYLSDDLRRGIERGQHAAKIALTHDGDLTHITLQELTTTGSTEIHR